MEPQKPHKDALLVEDHWEWKYPDLSVNIHYWADENGLLHREGAPAEIWYREDGTIGREWWWFHGKRHREGAPAGIGYKRNGTIKHETWYLHGERHREGAPAVIWYRQDGTIESESWYIRGESSIPTVKDTEPTYHTRVTLKTYVLGFCKYLLSFIKKKI